MNKTTFRHRLNQVLEPAQPHDRLSRTFDILLIILIVTNVIAVMLSTVPTIGLKWGKELAIFEWVSLGIFTLEYIARIWSSVDAPAAYKWKQGLSKKSLTTQRLRYMVTPMAIIDLLAILPSYLAFLFNVDLRVLRLFRLTRLIKLGRYSQSMQMLITVLQREARVLLAALSVLLIIMSVAATGMYYIEQTAQPEAFGSIPAALWWALTTLTTVGYGDVTPITTAGRFFGGVITILGVAIFALPAGILASSLSEQLRLRRDTFNKHVRDALSDGELTSHEIKRLHQIRDTLELDDKQAKLLIELAREEHATSTPSDPYQYCPHCGIRLSSQGVKETKPHGHSK